MSWEQVDEGWGRKAVDFATLTEPATCREYLCVHQRLGVGTGDRLLDIACGAGLAIELATIRGAECSGIDASPRLVAVARDRSPDADIRVGDMLDLPWEDESFDIVTTFRGIWGTTVDAFDEAHRVLRPGGRLALTVWGDVSKSPGAWTLAPLILASEDKVMNQAQMVSLGRPGSCEQVMREHGFEPEERFEIPFVFEYPDPQTYARGIAATGPAYEAIQNVGEQEFIEAAVKGAEPHVRDGLPLRGRVQVFGYIGHKA
jgi:ubiquinone/menaquinone biosynthesis C-methylase UbiE